MGLSFENNYGSEKPRNEFVVDTMKYIKSFNPNKFCYLEKITNRSILPNQTLLNNFWQAMNNGHYLFNSYTLTPILLPDYHPFSYRVAGDFSIMFCVWIISLLFWFGAVFLSDGGDANEKNPSNLLQTSNTNSEAY